MESRIAYLQVAPGAYKAMLGLEESLLHLIKLQGSQVTGCAYCIDMHWKDLRAAGETEQPMQFAS
jgi:AhpD family alkylhydroperoxidase